MHRSRSLAFWAAAFTTTCVPARNLTSPIGRANPSVEGAVEAPTIGPTPVEPCASSSAEQTEVTDPASPVILVVLDGVRWQEVFSGVDPVLAATHRAGPVVSARTLLPSLYAALDTRGAAVGAPGHGVIAASGPNFVSLPGYTEIFGGRSPADVSGQRVRRRERADHRGRRARSSRERLGRRGDRFVGAHRTRRDADAVAHRPLRGAAGRHGSAVSGGDPSTREVLDRGARADPRPGHDAFRPDRYTAELALRYLEARRPAFLFVGLGEPDEYAHEDDYRGYLASLRAADDFFGRLFAALDGMGERGRRSLVLVTADHGRARDYRDHGAGLPESARVWLLALGGPVRARGFVQGPFARRLADVAPTIRQVVGLPLDEAAEPERR